MIGEISHDSHHKTQPEHPRPHLVLKKKQLPKSLISIYKWTDSFLLILFRPVWYLLFALNGAHFTSKLSLVSRDSDISGGEQSIMVYYVHILVQRYYAVSVSIYCLHWSALADVFVQLSLSLSRFYWAANHFLPDFDYGVLFFESIKLNEWTRFHYENLGFVKKNCCH